VGENGIEGSDIGGQCDTQYRADLFIQKLQAAFNAGVIGYMPWSYSQETSLGTCSVSFGPASPVMADFAAINAWLGSDNSVFCPRDYDCDGMPDTYETARPCLSPWEADARADP